MGRRGPIPKRSNQRRRTNSPAPTKVTTTGRVVEHPAPDPSWCEAAKDWYEALAVSGQATLFGPSDWQAARLAAGLLDRWHRDPRKDPKLLAEIRLWSDMLLVTEGARRRVGVEVQRDPAPEHDVGAEAVRHYRARLSVVSDGTPSPTSR